MSPNTLDRLNTPDVTSHGPEGQGGQSQLILVSRSLGNRSFTRLVVQQDNELHYPQLALPPRGYHVTYTRSKVIPYIW